MSGFHKHWAASVLATTLVVGCAGLPGAPVQFPEPQVERVTTDQFMALLQRFVAADGTDRSAIYTEVVSDLATEPSPENRLRLALLQGWPGHPYSRPADAMSTIEALLDDDALSGEARDLATVLRFWIAQRGTDQRLQRSLRARIAALEQELSDTREQLAALAAIERLIDPAICNPDETDDCPQDRPNPAR